MNISAPFIARPVATTLLTLAIALAGILGFSKLPVSPLPQVDFPTISVTATLPGASPNTVATSVAEPLERHLGQIADVTEMTSQSGIGQARITLQFDVSRDIDGAARDVEAAINAARADLPSNLPSNPIYRKVNPADAPILILALTSKTMTQGQMYDAASNILAQRLSQLSGIGNVIIGGSTLPAVRVELNPQALYKYGIGLEDVRAALASANANSPKGTIDDGNRRYQIYTNDQANVAADYAPLVIAYRNGAAVRLSDVADVQNSVQDVRNLGMSNGQPSVLVILFRQPNANIIETIDNVKAELPHLEAAMPADMNVNVAIDRSTTIRTSLHDTELTLVMAVILVTIVVFLFLRNLRATLIPSVAVPISILGTFGAMYLLGYSLDILSLMALTIATGFVVDDAIVVLENISRHIDDGMPHVQAAFRGAREVGFTVLSISLSLIAVFIPILLMGGILGRLFREFTVTLSIAILVSLAISLTTTPMMCALLLRTRAAREAERGSNIFERVRNGYGRTLTWALRHSGLVLLIFIATICLNVGLYIIVPKGFFPQQDTGRLVGSLEADQSISFQLMSKKLRQMMNIVRQDPAVENVVGYTGVGSGGGYAQINKGNVFVSLKPLSQRVGVDQVIARLRPKLAQVPGGRLYLAAVQDLRAGGRQSNAQYQYTLQSDNVEDLYEWTPKLVDALEHNSIVTDVSSDQQQKGLGDLSRHRPRHHRASRHQPAANRQYAVRRVRSASGLRHLQRHQPVPRGDGDRPALHAVSQFAARRLRGHLRADTSRNRDNQCAGGSGQSGDREWDRGNSAASSTLCVLHDHGALCRLYGGQCELSRVHDCLPRPAKAARPRHQAHRQQHPPVPLRRAAPSPTRWPIPATAPHPPAQRSARPWKP